MVPVETANGSLAFGQYKPSDIGQRLRPVGAPSARDRRRQDRRVHVLPLDRAAVPAVRAAGAARRLASGRQSTNTSPRPMNAIRSRSSAEACRSSTRHRWRRAASCSRASASTLTAFAATPVPRRTPPPPRHLRASSAHTRLYSAGRSSRASGPLIANVIVLGGGAATYVTTAEIAENHRSWPALRRTAATKRASLGSAGAVVAIQPSSRATNPARARRDVGKWPARSNPLEPAARHRARARAPSVLDGDDPRRARPRRSAAAARPPDIGGRTPLDTLAADVDARPARKVWTNAARLSPGSPSEACPRAISITSLPSGTRAFARARPPRHGRRSSTWRSRRAPAAELRAGQRGRAQQRAHPAAEAPARDERQTFARARGTGRRTASRPRRRASARRPSPVRGRASARASRIPERERAPIE